MKQKEQALIHNFKEWEFGKRALWAAKDKAEKLSVLRIAQLRKRPKDQPVNDPNRNANPVESAAACSRGIQSEGRPITSAGFKRFVGLLPKDKGSKRKGLDTVKEDSQKMMADKYGESRPSCCVPVLDEASWSKMLWHN